VLAAVGPFAGLFSFPGRRGQYRDPVLVASTDSVGTKVKLAALLDRYDTVGIDLVNHCVNDILTAGAEPLFFLDYVAGATLTEEQKVALVKGVATACRDAGCALLGGETAEMPDLYRPRHFDLAGFAVGVVERRRMMQPQHVRPGDQLIGIASDGLHSNGYSLVRKLLLEDAGLALEANVRTLGEPLVDALLRPTRIYARPVLDVLRRYRGRPRVTGMAHITGGGLPGNVPRMLPDDCDAVIRRGAWPLAPIFGLLERHGVAEAEMYRVFNMGIGFVLAVRPASAAPVLRTLTRAGEQAFVIGRVRRGHGRLELR
jgi:phosphoribosylformylglycinamidine cyclo-ligase